MRPLLLACLLLSACAPGALGPDGTQPTGAFVGASPGRDAPPFGVPPTNEIRTSDYEGPTPGVAEGARTVSTPELQALMASSPKPVLIDVLDGVSTSIPGATLLVGAGQGSSLGDGVQRRLTAKLASLTRGDRSRAVVFFCLSQTCWLSHNAVVRAVAAGYRNVLWYRGGRNAWLEAGLPLAPVRPASW